MKYGKSYKKRSDYCSSQSCWSENNTYAYCLECLKKYGLKANMSSRDIDAVNRLRAAPAHGNATHEEAALTGEGQKETETRPPAKLDEQRGNVSAECEDMHPADEEGLFGRGLFHYRKWWERSEVDIFVNGHKFTGFPIFTDKNTLRVINDDFSFFIPLEKIDYIRTTDGLKSSNYYPAF